MGMEFRITIDESGDDVIWQKRLIYTQELNPM